ncbi:MAG TPA: LLM class flavin-dependent oxidoreductase [Candidatus Binataceae bacterium]|jgi:alkanesulfonate monooxygenase SsuD/methylene tetrahydromethanopterin reductase-like flavin-dependent oxidoreductase (luciferase family)|nr:LLM class flavin-dependent oxidoreductase [Candidatus Binataceae bacterium]
MELGLFLMPSHPPERDLMAGQQWDLAVLRAADRLGYSEAWIGEHFTSPWEPNPAPDLLIAQALKETSRIKLAPGAHLLPFHHPAELACRVAFMDHLAQGRYMLGIGASGLPSDWQLFSVDGFGMQTREMTRESLAIMLKVWESDGGLEYKGKYWSVNVPGPMLRTLRHHLKPFQKPHPPIGIAGLSPGSETLKLAGEHGFIPLSLNMSPGYVATHWEAVVEGARRTGRRPRRRDWRIVREIFVAETDAEAHRHCVKSMMGRMMREYLLPLMADFQFTKFLKDDPSVPDDAVTPEYLVDHGWLVGSPRTVRDKLARMYKDLGGFGTLLLFTFDYADNPEPWFNSMRLLAEEVLPHFRELDPDSNQTARAEGQRRTV